MLSGCESMRSFKCSAGDDRQWYWVGCTFEEQGDENGSSETEELHSEGHKG